MFPDARFPFHYLRQTLANFRFLRERKMDVTCVQPNAWDLPRQWKTTHERIIHTRLCMAFWRRLLEMAYSPPAGILLGRAGDGEAAATRHGLRARDHREALAAGGGASGGLGWGSVLLGSLGGACHRAGTPAFDLATGAAAGAAAGTAAAAAGVRGARAAVVNDDWSGSLGLACTLAVCLAGDRRCLGRAPLLAARALLGDGGAAFSGVIRGLGGRRGGAAILEGILALELRAGQGWAGARGGEAGGPHILWAAPSRQRRVARRVPGREGHESGLCGDPSSLAATIAGGAGGWAAASSRAN
mmetsp:Transcript_26936/g.58622  ORF Transcript_26936/g.58622 Transcript_26936/m.58622 type:complete len:301 (+) Transcript_26936:368-1270(+)